MLRQLWKRLRWDKQLKGSFPPIYDILNEIYPEPKDKTHWIVDWKVNPSNRNVKKDGTLYIHFTVSIHEKQHCTVIVKWLYEVASDEWILDEVDGLIAYSVRRRLVTFHLFLYDWIPKGTVRNKMVSTFGVMGSWPLFYTPGDEPDWELKPLSKFR